MWCSGAAGHPPCRRSTHQPVAHQSFRSDKEIYPRRTLMSSGVGLEEAGLGKITGISRNFHNPAETISHKLFFSRNFLFPHRFHDLSLLPSGNSFIFSALLLSSIFLQPIHPNLVWINGIFSMTIWSSLNNQPPSHLIMVKSSWLDDKRRQAGKLLREIVSCVTRRILEKKRIAGEEFEKVFVVVVVMKKYVQLLGILSDSI